MQAPLIPTYLQPPACGAVSCHQLRAWPTCSAVGQHSTRRAAEGSTGHGTFKDSGIQCNDSNMQAELTWLGTETKKSTAQLTCKHHPSPHACTHRLVCCRPAAFLTWLRSACCVALAWLRACGQHHWQNPCPVHPCQKPDTGHATEPKSALWPTPAPAWHASCQPTTEPAGVVVVLSLHLYAPECPMPSACACTLLPAWPTPGPTPAA